MWPAVVRVAARVWCQPLSLTAASASAGDGSRTDPRANLAARPPVCNHFGLARIGKPRVVIDWQSSEPRIPSVEIYFETICLRTHRQDYVDPPAKYHNLRYSFEVAIYSKEQRVAESG